MRLFRYTYIALIVASLNTLAIFAQSDNDSVIISDEIIENASTVENQPEAAYRKGDFATSINLYESLISEKKAVNQESPELYYNLANAYFRDNQIAKAIINYERALLLDPGDNDIRHNLRFARSRIEDKIDSTDNFFLNRWLYSFENIFSSNGWTIVGIVCFVMLMISIGVYMIATTISLRKVSFYISLALLSFVVIANSFAFNQKNKITKHSHAIVISSSVSIYTSPDAHSQELFRLHEGAKVTIKREENNWFEISIANGGVGWLQKKNVETI